VNNEASFASFEDATVHIWQVSLLATFEQLVRLEQSLSFDEVTRANNFFFPRDRDRFVVARASLRAILAWHIDRHPNDIDFTYGIYGKPSVVVRGREPSIEFSLSHSEGLALIAVTIGNCVGVDIEKIRPELATTEIAMHSFSPYEQAALVTVGENDRTAAFFKCWTSKEAYIKGLGTGLTTPLHEFDVSVYPNRPAKLLRPYNGITNGDMWRLHDLEVKPGYAATLAVAREPRSIAMIEWRHPE